MTTIWWSQAEGGGANGPFTEDELRSLMADGTLTPSSRIWSSAGEAWPPTDLSVLRPRTGLRRQASARAWGWGLLSAATLTCWLLFGGVIDFTAVDGGRNLSVSTVRWLWPATGAGLAILTLAVGAGWWFFPARLGVSAETKAVVRILAALTVPLGLTFAIIELRQTRYATDVVQVSQALTYVVTSDVELNRVTVTGSVGPGFAREVRRHLPPPGTPVTLEIDSLGGLVREALAVAAELEKRPGSTVIVRHECASACVVVLMGADRRLAAYDGWLDLHAASPVIATTDPLIAWNSAQQGVKAHSYMVRRGVPDAALRRAERLGPGHVLRLPAVAALDAGVLTGLLDGDAQISRSEAGRRLGPNLSLEYRPTP
ncbi:MAG TPA: GYF domain-containing protein [Caulobacteraceae bacterium]|nr:GYF domain-containing protein [Caulobacteraceae bacterium]